MPVVMSDVQLQVRNSEELPTFKDILNIQLYRPDFCTFCVWYEQRILGGRENNVSELTERGQIADTALQLYITTRSVRRGFPHP